MTVWNEADHPRDEEGKFTEKGGGTTSDNDSDSIKMRRRANILYGSDEEYIKKYYGKDRETDDLKRYENIQLDNMRQNVLDKSIETALIKSNNAMFSDSDLERARSFIAKNEGCELNAYQDIANVWTIGYGHTGKVDGKPISAGMKITKEKAEELYRKDFEDHIQPLKKVEVALTNNQKIALASFIYNMGQGTFLRSGIFRRLNAGDFKGAADKFDEYIKAPNPKTKIREVSKGLINRRRREKELFLTPDGE